jgi:membrane-associated protease RseP (regulator of RpoE activity)
LIPIGFLDGGRIAKAITMWLWVPGLVLLGYLYLEHQNPLLLLVGVLGVVELFSRYRQRHDVAAAASPRDTLPNRLILGASYFALVALITLTMLHNPAFGWGTL